MRHRPRIFPSHKELVREVAEEIVVRLHAAVEARGIASLVLSGGSTPRGVYEMLGSSGFTKRVAWGNVHLFWGDERCVPPSSPESNFRMANEALLARIVIPPENVHRMNVERPPGDAARAYELEIQRFFSLDDGQMPGFDVVLLGIGDDGHVASLFPGTDALKVTDRIVTEVYVEKLKKDRITMTIPAINNANAVIFVVEGNTKAAILRDVLESSRLLYPAQYVNPEAGELLWFVDHTAASKLDPIGHP